jgi:hypothetical protein
MSELDFAIPADRVPTEPGGFGYVMRGGVDTVMAPQVPTIQLGRPTGGKTLPEPSSLRLSRNASRTTGERPLRAEARDGKEPVA